jgi:hypothetical protein
MVAVAAALSSSESAPAADRCSPSSPRAAAGVAGLDVLYHCGDRTAPPKTVRVWVILCAISTDLREVLLGVKPGSKREDLLTLTRSDEYWLIGNGKYGTRTVKDRRTGDDTVLHSVTMDNAKLRTEAEYLDALDKYRSAVHSTCVVVFCCWKRIRIADALLFLRLEEPALSSLFSARTHTAQAQGGREAAGVHVHRGL